MIFGFILGITGILDRNWFYDFEGTGLVPGADFPLAFIVELILVVVLFYGGLSIDIKKLEGVLLPGTLLATVGAFLVTLIIAVIISSIFPLVFGSITALIIGALLAPNDPIAVFSAQDSFKMNPKADTIAKFESGLDDTMVTTLVILICIPIAIQMDSNPLASLISIIWSGVFQFFAPNYHFFIGSEIERKCSKSDRVNFTISGKSFYCDVPLKLAAYISA